MNNMKRGFFLLLLLAICLLTNGQIMNFGIQTDDLFKIEVCMNYVVMDRPEFTQQQLLYAFLV